MIPLANHLWQSTLFAGMALLLSFALRTNRAQIRYRLWLAASVKFLIPFSLLVALGHQFEHRDAAAVAPPLSSAIEQIAQPFALPPTPVPDRPAAPSTMPVLLVAVWLTVCATILIRWCARWQRIRLVLRAASPVPIQAPVRVLSSPTPIEPGVVGILRPVLLLPEGIADRLTPAQFHAILAHELCHVRRRDNLASAIHMLVEAVFWFHPLVWWIGARMVEERERACDEEVLRLGNEAETYAAGILNVCKFYLESSLPCASGVTGADLKKRIAAIMALHVSHRLTVARKLLLAAAGIAAVAGPIVIGILHPPRSAAQSLALRFEVATIKPLPAEGTRGGLIILPGGGLHMVGVTLKDLIVFAYDLRDNQVAGGPRWITSETYEIVGKPERPGAEDTAPTVAAPGTTAWDRVRLRTQALLAERFHLAFHKTAREQSVYALVVARDGPKLQPSKEGDLNPPRTMRSRGRIDAERATTHMLAAVLSNWLGRPVLDRTGLAGTYDYKLEYAQETGSGEANASDASSVSVFAALQQQLGLKLESTRGPVETFVIDRAEKPTAN